MPSPLTLPPDAQATDPATLQRLFGTEDLLPLWIAEPAIALAPPIQQALRARADTPWAGYETRHERLLEAFWTWASRRHGWTAENLTTLVSPSIGTSIGVLIDRLSAPGNGVIIQPPVFTDFKPLVTSAERRVVRSPLRLVDDRYEMDVDGLEAAAAEESTTLMIVCNPHNPVGRAWTAVELRGVADICARHDVVVIADEIHADLALPGHAFTPFARAAAGTGARWASLHGPIKTFGLAGVCDTLLVTDDDAIAEAFQTTSNRLHLTRNNVFSLAAFEAGYEHGGPWLDELVDLVVANTRRLEEGVSHGLRVLPAEATYLAWLDLRSLGLDVPDLVDWMGRAGVAMSPGHWFGREGAGFARLTVAAPESMIEEAITRLNRAADRLGRSQ